MTTAVEKKSTRRAAPKRKRGVSVKSNTKQTRKLKAGKPVMRSTRGLEGKIADNENLKRQAKGIEQELETLEAAEKKISADIAGLSKDIDAALKKSRTA